MSGATVFTMPGFFGSQSTIPPMLGGSVAAPKSGNIVQPVPYNNYSGITISYIEAGAAMLNAAAHATTGGKPMIFFGHSEGAVCISYWLQNYGPTTTIDPAELSCILLGNSVNPYGGALGPMTGALWQNWFPGAALTVTTPFKTVIGTRQYDGWADWSGANVDAALNSFAGQGSVHPDYTSVSLTDPTAAKYVVGNVTYLWWMTEPVPIYGTIFNSWTMTLDAAIRPTIESAYNRPVTIPNPGALVVPPMSVTATMPTPRVQLTVPAPVMAVTAAMPTPTII